MKIKSLTLTNFGRHGSLVCDMDAAVVGIRGPNGVGKSTLLEGLKFAVTSILEDNANTYMRNGGKHGKTLVEMDFSKYGKDGHIQRNITRTTSGRKLTWDGESYTSSKEVDAIMRGLLNADKRSVLNCVFVPQGKLHEVLFGDRADREKQFLRMTGCSHFENVARAASAQAAKLRSDVQDLEPAIREQAINQEQYAHRFHELGNQLKDLVDPAPQLGLAKFVQGWRQRSTVARERMNGSMERIVRKLQEVKTDAVFADAHALLQNEALRRAELTKQMAQLERDIQAATDEGKQLQTILDLLPQFHKAQAQHQETEALVVPETHQHRLDAINGEIASTQAALAGIETAAKQLAAYRTDEAALLTAQADKATWQIAVDRIRPQLTAVQDLLASSSNAEASEKLGMKQLRLDLMTRFESCTHNAVECPVCGTSSANKLTREALRAEIERLRQELDAARDARQQLIDQDRRLQRELSDAESNLNVQKHREETLAARIRQAQNDKLHEIKDSSDLKRELHDRLTVLRTTQLQLNGIEEERQRGLAKKAADQKVWAAWTSHSNYELLLSSDEATCRGRLTLKQETANSLRQEKLKLNDSKLASEAWTRGTEEEGAIYERHRLDLVNLTAELQQKSVGPMLEKMTDEELAAHIFGLEEEQRQRNELLTGREEMQKLITQVEGRIRDLEARQMQFASKLALASEMDRVAEVFGKEGITKHYLGDMYTLILERVGPYLERANAPFVVRKGEGTLNFEFMRTDEESEWMDQSKLSGGQKVKMAVSFLLALQQIIIPDVGLLVLDEPTTHLDADSREGFRDLLMDMQAVLERTECQVIVCDHCPEIESALQKKVILTAPK